MFISYTFYVAFNRLIDSKSNICEDLMGMDIILKPIYKSFSGVWNFTNAIIWKGKVCMEWVIHSCYALTAKPMEVCYNIRTKKVGNLGYVKFEFTRDYPTEENTMKPLKKTVHNARRRNCFIIQQIMVIGFEEDALILTFELQYHLKDKVVFEGWSIVTYQF